MYAVMWSEHCSYKSSRAHLGRFPTEAPWVLVGPGEGAGVIDVGDGLAVAVRIESHNHPSAVEPYQGAATGVGGIIRDIFSMGARPIALMDPLRFGPLDDARTRYLFEGVVSGISGYGNAVGVPTVGGEVVFDDCYRDNPLVNVLCLGMLPDERLVLARAEGAGNLAVLLGSATGRDGIGGASVLASAGLRGGQRGEAAVGAGRRPVRGEAADRGVPRAARRRARGRRAGPRRGRPLVRGVGDRGEGRRGHGRRRRARRQARAGHEPGRGADVREPGAHARDRRRPRNLDAVLELCARWEIRATVVGRVTDTGRFRVFDGLFDAIGVPGENPPPPLGDDAADGRRPTAQPIADVPVGSLGDGPLYHRPVAPPGRPGRAARPTIPAPELRAKFPAGADLAGELLALLATPTIADKIVGVAPVRPPAVPQHGRRARRRRRGAAA